MKPIKLFQKLGPIFLTASAFAQTLTLTGPTSAKPGQNINLALSISNPGTDSGVSALQWQLSLPVGYSVSVVPGTVDSSMTVTCTTNGSFCILWAMSSTNIANGQIANIVLKVPANAVVGNTSIPVTSPLGSNSTGNGVTIAPGAGYNLNILDKRDINGDGTVNVADVQAMLNEVIAAQSTPGSCVDDVTSDGRCDLLDVMAIILKALGVIQ